MYVQNSKLMNSPTGITGTTYVLKVKELSTDQVPRLP